MLCILTRQLEINGDIKSFACGLKLKQSALVWSALISLNEIQELCFKISKMELEEEEQYKIVKDFLLNH